MKSEDAKYVIAQALRPLEALIVLLDESNGGEVNTSCVIDVLAVCCKEAERQLIEAFVQDEKTDTKRYIELLDMLSKRIDADQNIQGEMLAKMTRTIELLKMDFLDCQN